MKLDPEPANLETEYAFWLDPTGTFRIQYSLPVFHEIDFQVNEGYRRIPHGGIETGGILWGRMEAEAVTIEAFRQIDCEHAAGPSFLLSERDLAGLPELFSRAAGEEELRHLQPVGWFIAHTRGPLTLTDRERAVFDQFFPGPGKLTMLVKPERFQPTRFGLLVRRADGSTPSDASEQAFILPLPGRAGKGVAASIPAPGSKPASPSSDRPPVAVTSLPAAPAVASKPRPPLSTALRPESEAERKPVVQAEPVTAGRIEPLEPGTQEPEMPSAKAAPVLAVPSAETLPNEIRRKRMEQFRGVVPEPVPPVPPLVAARRRPSAGISLFLLLLLSAALGCAVGYFAYLQLPSPYIEIQAQKRSAGLLVQWPARQTRGVEYAAVRVDDGPPQLLTEGQKETGMLEVPMRTNNTKVEIIAQHWIRDSRGIIRYVSAMPSPRATNPTASSAPQAFARSAGRTSPGKTSPVRANRSSRP